MVAEWLHCALVMSSTLQPLKEYSAVLLRSKSPSLSVLLKAFLYCVFVGQFLHFKSKVQGDKGCRHSHGMEGGGVGVCANTTSCTLLVDYYIKCTLYFYLVIITTRCHSNFPEMYGVIVFSN